MQSVDKQNFCLMLNSVCFLDNPVSDPTHQIIYNFPEL